MKYIEKLEDYKNRHIECKMWFDSLCKSIFDKYGIDMRENGKHIDEYMLRYATYHHLRNMGYSYAFIGELINRTHSSVLHACRKATWFDAKKDDLFIRYFDFVQRHDSVIVLRRVGRTWKFNGL